MIRAAIAAAALVALAAGSAAAQGDLLQRGRNMIEGSQGSAAAPNASGLSEGQADSGLREALRVAAQRTVARVGKTDGYEKDPAIHIPLPSFLETARKTLGSVGAGGTLDDLDLRMNRAAETAAQKAYTVFADAVSKMTVTDAKGIVTGPNDAATQYLKRTTTAPLTKEFRPIVDHALSDAGAMKAYQGATQHLSSSTGGLGSMLPGGTQGQAPAGFDFTGFVVEKALDGLFHYIAQEEAAIRTNPAARTTDLLKQVFGH